MNQNNAAIQPEQPAPETFEPSQTPTQAESVATPAKAEKTQPGRLQRFFRKLLVWLVVIAIAFLAGILTYHFVRYKPLSENNVKTQAALDQANQEITDLQAETKKIATLESEKSGLQDQLETAAAHSELLQVLVDLSNARLALFQNDVEGAKAALANTPQRLDNLLPFIAKYDTNLAQSMPQRLGLIVSGLERNTETVKIDMELLTKELLEIEGTLFGN
jgi:type II secretory pathway component PulM